MAEPSEYAKGYAAGVQAGKNKEHRLAAQLNDAIVRAEKAEASVASVLALADKWDREAGAESAARREYGKQVVTVTFAVRKIKEATR